MENRGLFEITQNPEIHAIPYLRTPPSRFHETSGADDLWMDRRSDTQTATSMIFGSDFDGVNTDIQKETSVMFGFG